jgi:spermidine synthase
MYNRAVLTSHTDTPAGASTRADQGAPDHVHAASGSRPGTLFVLVALALLFLFSGFSALVYQIVWLRMLALVFGVTVYAASAVLTSFMGGLALGSWLGGRAAERVRHPLAAFAVVEIGIGLSALAVAAALDAAQAVYVAVHTQAPDALALLTFVRLVCAGAVLLVPTTLMGASLPLVSRYVSLRGGALASRVGILYAANTTGGIAGTLLAGFVLIGGIGIIATTRLAVAINLAIGVAALALAYAARGEQPAASPARPRALGSGTRVQRAVLAVLALAGFAGLALEVVWFRILVLFIPATTYAFTTMLATVLLGIAAGSAVAAAILPRMANPVRTLARVQVATGILAIVSMTLLVFSYRLGWRTSGMVQASIVAMLPATLLMGATFPLGLAIWLRGVSSGIGHRVGVLYAVNVCGAVAGALAGGFLLLPLLGTHASLLLLAAVYCGAGWLLITADAGRKAGGRMALSAVLLWAFAAATLPDIYDAVLARRYGPGERVMFRAEGVQTTATVHFQPNGQRVLYLDGLHQANDSEAMVRVHAEIGHLPMLLHPDPQQALVIGLGGGVTAGAVSTHRATVDVVELGASVVAAASFFAHVNGNLLERPNVRMRVDDGRNYLLTTHRKYDVLTADIIQPVHAGAGNLYSREYFTLARGVLGEGGLMMQWIGHREEEHYKLIMRTFLEVFPHATLWGDGTLMVGSTSPLRFSREGFERHLADPDTRFALARVRLDSFDALRERYTAGAEEMRRFVGGGPVLTDDRPLLEYHRSLRGGGAPVDVSGVRGDVERHIPTMP